MSSIVGKLGELGGKFREGLQVGDNPYKEGGMRFGVDQKFGARVALLNRIEPYIWDTGIDIDDRMNYSDSAINTIALAWGRGRTDAIWTKSYHAWRGMKGMWNVYESSCRHLLNEVRMAKVTELYSTFEDSTDKNGNPFVDVKQGWSQPRMIHATTYLHKLQSDRAQGKETIKLLSVETVRSMVDPDQANDVMFVKDNVEETVRLFGESCWIQSAFKMINMGFHEKDVTTQSILVFHGTQPQQQGYQIQTTAEAKPTGDGRTGVHRS